MHGIYTLPVTRAAFPSKRIALPRSLVERRTSVQDILIEIRMALRRRHEPDRTVTMFVLYRRTSLLT